MKLALIGASGFVGTQLLTEALQRGHEVTTIVRNPEKVKIQNSLLNLQKADVTNTDALAEILRGHDIVLNAYNAGWSNPNIYDDFLKGSNSILEASKRAKVKRLLVVGGAGSLFIAPNVQLVDTPEFASSPYRPGALAARDFLNVLKKEEAISWTFLSPAINLFPGERTGQFRLGNDEPVMNSEGKSEISVQDLAVALLDEVEKGQFINKRFTVGY
ncbi:MAG: NAD(P)-dependent oxidoreductase [Bacteroidota bacterium]|nr:NAD(P)-dependent oxidoreductase [Bacteroidota bacterium]